MEKKDFGGLGSGKESGGRDMGIGPTGPDVDSDRGGEVPGNSNARSTEPPAEPGSQSGFGSNREYGSEEPGYAPPTDNDDADARDGTTRDRP